MLIAKLSLAPLAPNNACGLPDSRIAGNTTIKGVRVYTAKSGQFSVAPELRMLHTDSLFSRIRFWAELEYPATIQAIIDSVHTTFYVESVENIEDDISALIEGMIKNSLLQ